MGILCSSGLRGIEIFREILAQIWGTRIVYRIGLGIVLIVCIEIFVILYPFYFILFNKCFLFTNINNNILVSLLLVYFYYLYNIIYGFLMV